MPGPSHPVAPVELWPTEAAFDEATAEFAKQGNLGVPEGPMSFQQLFKMCAERSNPINGLTTIPYPRNRELVYAGGGDQGILFSKTGNLTGNFREIGVPAIGEFPAWHVLGLDWASPTRYSN